MVRTNRFVAWKIQGLRSIQPKKVLAAGSGSNFRDSLCFCHDGAGQGIGDEIRRLAAFLCRVKNGSEPRRNLTDTLSTAAVRLAQMLGHDVDDAACVDQVVRCVQDTARGEQLAVFRRRELVVCSAADYLGLELAIDVSSRIPPNAHGATTSTSAASNSSGATTTAP